MASIDTENSELQIAGNKNAIALTGDFTKEWHFVSLNSSSVFPLYLRTFTLVLFGVIFRKML